MMLLTDAQSYWVIVTIGLAGGLLTVWSVIVSLYSEESFIRQLTFVIMPVSGIIVVLLTVVKASSDSKIQREASEKAQAASVLEQKASNDIQGALILLSSLASQMKIEKNIVETNFAKMGSASRETLDNVNQTKMRLADLETGFATNLSITKTAITDLLASTAKKSNAATAKAISVVVARFDRAQDGNWTPSIGRTPFPLPQTMSNGFHYDADHAYGSTDYGYSLGYPGTYNAHSAFVLTPPSPIISSSGFGRRY